MKNIDFIKNLFLTAAAFGAAYGFMFLGCVIATL